MLVDKKFIFLSLPRCASTSFLITCLKNDITIEHFNSSIDNQLLNNNSWKMKNNEDLADTLTHLHEPLDKLQSKFGNEYEVISIRRNKYERFLSLWKHIIDELHRENKIELAVIFSKLTIDDVFGKLSINDISTTQNRELTINKFLNTFKVSHDELYIKNMLQILFTPLLELIKDNSKIIWFDINHLNELNNWVSIKLEKEFKLEKTNSSQKFKCAIQNDDEFKEKYDRLFSIFEKRKLNKTLI